MDGLTDQRRWSDQPWVVDGRGHGSQTGHMRWYDQPKSQLVNFEEYDQTLYVGVFRCWFALGLSENGISRQN